MKKSLIAATAGVLASAALLVCATPAMAQPRIGFGVSVGVPVGYVAPPSVAYGAPAPVVYGGYGGYGYGGYGPVVRVGSPYYYHDWRYYHGYHGYGYHGGYHGWHR